MRSACGTWCYFDWIQKNGLRPWVDLKKKHIETDSARRGKGPDEHQGALHVTSPEDRMGWPTLTCSDPPCPSLRKMAKSHGIAANSSHGPIEFNNGMKKHIAHRDMTWASSKWPWLCVDEGPRAMG